MADYLVDTDVLIDFFRGNAKAKRFIKSSFSSIALSAITVAELYSGVRDGEERVSLDEFMSLIQVVPVSSELALEGGLMKRDYSKSHGTCLADAIIAATANAKNATLCTLNKKHFPMLKNIKVPYRKQST